MRKISPLLLKDSFTLAREGLKILLFSIFLSLSSYVKFYTPFSPIPFTAQTLAVFISVAVLKEKALFSELLWIGMGILGVPVFAGSNILGPSFGYIIGFLGASLFLIKFLPSATSFYGYLFLFFSAHIVIYIMGVGGLMFYFGWSIAKAVSIGVFPFLGEDILKVFAASAFTFIVIQRKL